jgi:hypothetical protein
MKVLSVVMAVIITAFVGISSSFAGSEGAGKSGSHGGRGFLRVLEKLDLSADQQHEIASILGKHRDEMIPKSSAGFSVGMPMLLKVSLHERGYL